MGEQVWHTGYRPGVVGDVVALHGRWYAQACGFGSAFEAQVAAGLGSFVPRLDRPQNGLWSVTQDERLMGAIAIDGEAANGPQLRWFIVDDAARGQGVGQRLLQQALAFCDERGFAQVTLWTFAGLDAARHLYERHGFVLTQEGPGTTWGTRVTEQRFVRRQPAR